MKVFTKLVNLDFVVGSMERDGHILLIKSDQSKSLPAEVEMTPQDALDFVKAALSRKAISFILLFPFLFLKYKRAGDGE